MVYVTIKYCFIFLQITVFQEFFISIYKPYSVVQSERVKLDILVFNYQSQELNVSSFYWHIDGKQTRL